MVDTLYWYTHATAQRAEVEKGVLGSMCCGMARCVQAPPRGHAPGQTAPVILTPVYLVSTTSDHSLTSCTLILRPTSREPSSDHLQNPQVTIYRTLK